MASQIYNSFKGKLDGSFDWGGNVIKVALVTSTYVPNIDTHQFFSDITDEVVGTGYTAGGKQLTTPVISVDTTNDIAKYDADDVTWTTSTITARGAVVYKDTGTPSTSPLVAYIDFGSDKSSTSGDFNLQWHVNGIFQIA